jgi:S-disulfanyl-L-cysteine oxidoreductase SoxD
MSTLRPAMWTAIATTLIVAACATPRADNVSQTTYSGGKLNIGTTLTSADLAKYFSYPADGRGLPPGKGDYAQGEKVYQTKCMACHGEMLQGSPQGDRLIGGRGTLVNNDPTKAPVKTIESYWPYATTIFDYVKRAMPFNAPGSLTDDEVYAVVAYILGQANIVAKNEVIDATTLPKVQMPNRNGFVSPDPRPDVR